MQAVSFVHPWCVKCLVHWLLLGLPETQQKPPVQPGPTAGSLGDPWVPRSSQARGISFKKTSIFSTPRKMNGWNLRIRAPWKMIFSSSRFQTIISGSMLIFGGVVGVSFPHPSEKYYIVKMGENLPQGSGWKERMFELPSPKQILFTSCFFFFNIYFFLMIIYYNAYMFFSHKSMASKFLPV